MEKIVKCPKCKEFLDSLINQQTITKVWRLTNTGEYEDLQEDCSDDTGEFLCPFCDENLNFNSEYEAMNFLKGIKNKKVVIHDNSEM